MKKWVEFEVQKTEYQISTYRGQVDEQELNSLISGNDIKFIKMTECYWYNDPDQYDEADEAVGTFSRLGEGAYSNFSGEVYIRGEKIVGVLILQSGFTGEPNIKKI